MGNHGHGEWILAGTGVWLDCILAAMILKYSLLSQSLKLSYLLAQGLVGNTGQPG